MNNTTAGLLADNFLKGGFPKIGKPSAERLDVQWIRNKAIAPVNEDIDIFASSRAHIRETHKKRIVQPGEVFKVGALRAFVAERRASLIGDFAAQKYAKIVEVRSLEIPLSLNPADVVREFNASFRRKTVGAWVSDVTSAYVAGELANAMQSSDDFQATAAKKIESSMATLINSIAEGLRDKGESTTFDLTSNGRFLDGVIKAILFRLPVVDFYEQRAFIGSLHSDFELAVSEGKISHKWWDVSLSGRGTITLTIKNEAPVAGVGEKPWKKARAIRFSALKRA